MSIEPTCWFCGACYKYRCKDLDDAVHCESYNANLMIEEGLSPTSALKWNLFLDDERDPPEDGREWNVFRTVNEAMLHINAFGCPTFISFDHDLGQDEDGNDLWNGYDLAKQLVARDIDQKYFIPVDFTFYVHSQNPVGRDNIHGYLTNYLLWRYRD